MEMLKSLTLKTRLAGLVVLVLALMAVTGLLTLRQLRGLSQAMDSVYQDRLLPMQQLRLVSQAFSVDLQSCAQRLADGRLTAAAAQVELAAVEKTVRRQWAAYLVTHLVEPERVLIARAEPLLAAGLKQLGHLRGLAEQGDVSGLREFSGEQLTPIVEPIAAVMGELIEVQLELGHREAEAGRASFDLALWLVLGLLLASVGLALGLGRSVWLQHRREQGDAEAGRLRVQQFFLALSQTNQLIVRTPESAQQLYDGLCRICVETGQASLAGVVLFDGEQFERVASHGSADRLMPGVPQRWRADSPFAQASMSTEAIRSGTHVLSNRVMSDRRLSQWRAGVIPPGVEAMAAFPVRRGGQVVGALSLLAGASDFFDTETIALLNEIVGDVSFALDKLSVDAAQKQALAAAEARLDLFKRLFTESAVPSLLTCLDDSRVLEINDAMCRRYGYAREELLGQRIGDLHVGLGHADRERFYLLLRRQGQVRNFEAGVLLRDGSIRRALVNGDLIEVNGQACVMSSSFDITDL